MITCLFEVEHKIKVRVSAILESIKILILLYSKRPAWFCSLQMRASVIEIKQEIILGSAVVGRSILNSIALSRSLS